MSRSILFVGFLVDLRWCQAPPGVCCQSARRSGWRRLKVVLQSSAAIDGVSDSHRGLRRSIDSIRLVVYCTHSEPAVEWPGGSIVGFPSGSGAATVLDMCSSPSGCQSARRSARETGRGRLQVWFRKGCACDPATGVCVAGINSVRHPLDLHL